MRDKSKRPSDRKNSQKSDKTQKAKKDLPQLIDSGGLRDSWEIYKKLHPHAEERLKSRRRLLKVYDLIHLAKVAHLIREGKAYQAYIPGRFRWTWNPEDYDKVTLLEIRDDIRKFIKERPEFSQPDDSVEDEFIKQESKDYPPPKHLRTYIRRAQDPKFLAFVQSLLTSAPALSERRRASKNTRLTRYAFEVAALIYSRPGQRVLRHDILRRFTTFGKKNLDRIAPILQLVDISSRPLNWRKKARGKERKQVIYYRIPFDQKTKGSGQNKCGNAISGLF